MEYKEIQGISRFIDQKDFGLIAPIKEDFGIEKYNENYDTLLEECTEKIMSFYTKDGDIFIFNEDLPEGDIVEILGNLKKYLNSSQSSIKSIIERNWHDLIIGLYNRFASIGNEYMQAEIASVFYLMSRYKIPETLLYFVESIAQNTTETHDDILQLFILTINNLFIDSAKFRVCIHNIVTPFMIGGVAVKPRPSFIKLILSYFIQVVYYVYTDDDSDSKDKIELDEEVFGTLITESVALAFSYDDEIVPTAMKLLNEISKNDECIHFLIDNGIESKILEQLLKHRPAVSSFCYELALTVIKWRHKNDTESNIVKTEKFYKLVGQDILELRDNTDADCLRIIKLIVMILDEIMPGYPDLFYEFISHNVITKLKKCSYFISVPLTFIIIRFIDVAGFDILQQFVTSDVLSIIARFYDDGQMQISADYASRVLAGLITKEEDTEQVMLNAILESELPALLEDFVDENECGEEEESESQKLLDILLPYKGE